MLCSIVLVSTCSFHALAKNDNTQKIFKQILQELKPY